MKDSIPKYVMLSLFCFIFFGCKNWSISSDASNANVKLIDENGDDYFGYSVSSK